MSLWLRYGGIGSASAAMIMAGIAANPTLAILSQGPLGKIVFAICKFFCTILASIGVVLLNVGAAKVQTIIDAGNFESEWYTADELIKKIRATGRELTDEEMVAIDQPVVDAFRRFVRFGRVRKR